MESQRLDLGPNRWVTAGGLAFIYVRLWKRRAVWITAAPIRDVEYGRASFSGTPYGSFIFVWSLILLCSGIPFIPLLMLVGDGDDFDWGWLILFVPPAISAINRLYRRGQFGLYVPHDVSDIPVRIFLNRGQEESDSVRGFCEFISNLRAESGDGLRRARTYLILPWWASIFFGLVFMLVAGYGAYYGLNKVDWQYAESYAAGLAVALTTIIISATSERSLLFNRVVRRAHSLLLMGDVQGANAILLELLAHKPNHKYANYLMTVARLMECNLELAEEMVIKHRTPGPYEPSRYHRIMDYKLWESRHGDN